MTIDTAQLRALLAAATGNGYRWHTEPTWPSRDLGETIVRFEAADGKGEALGQRWFQVGTDEQARLICAAVNALPQLLAIAEAAERIVEEGCCTCRQTMSCLVCKEILKLELLLNKETP